jgi:hypothetical protein
MAPVPFTIEWSDKDGGRVTAAESALTPGDRIEINGSLDLSTSINSSTKKQHTVPYHSDRPEIYSIDWSHRRWYSL